MSNVGILSPIVLFLSLIVQFFICIGIKSNLLLIFLLSICLRLFMFPIIVAYIKNLKCRRIVILYIKKLETEFKDKSVNYKEINEAKRNIDFVPYKRFERLLGLLSIIFICSTYSLIFLWDKRFPNLFSKIFDHALIDNTFSLGWMGNVLFYILIFLQVFKAIYINLIINGKTNNILKSWNTDKSQYISIFFYLIMGSANIGFTIFSIFYILVYVLIIIILDIIVDEKLVNKIIKNKVVKLGYSDIEEMYTSITSKIKIFKKVDYTSVTNRMQYFLNNKK